MKAHMNTVAGNEALVLDAATSNPIIDVFGLNPGFVKTGIRADLFGSPLLLKIAEAVIAFMTVKPEVYSERMVPLLVSPDIEGKSRTMFDNKARAVLASANVADPSYTKGAIAALQQLINRAMQTG